MSSNNTRIEISSWDDTTKLENYNWIKEGDSKYQFIKNNLINKTFPVLRNDDKELLLQSLIKVINLICVRFGFRLDNEEIFWEQLIQNNLLDLYALLGITLPFINQNKTNTITHQLKSLEDLYLEKNSRGNYIYTTSQYNRCIRRNVNKEISVIERPFLKEYYLQHLDLLLASIESASNKLYVNWVDIVPARMDNYQKSKLYTTSVKKYIGIINNFTINKEQSNITLINSYIDISSGLTYQDVYQVIGNHLFQEIKNHKWLIYDIIIQGKLTFYLNYLENKFDLQTIWDTKLWPQLSDGERDRFSYQWKNFLNSPNINDQTIFNRVYYFFSKYHRNVDKLIQSGELIPNKSLTDEQEEDDEDTKTTIEATRDARIGMTNVPIEEIYSFFYDQLMAFKKSWYYYLIKIKKQEYIIENPDLDLRITPKNIYNYAKSLISYISPGNKKYMQMPIYWRSLQEQQIEMVLYRMLDIPNAIYNNWTRSSGNWFNINKYIRNLYPNTNQADLPKINYNIHNHIRLKLMDIIFESLIYHGLLSDFLPKKTITNDSLIESATGSNDDGRKRSYKYLQMKELIFGENRKNYEKYAYYYLTNEPYGNLPPLKSKTYSTTNYEKKYFDFLTSDQIWTFTYAMNWVSQLNFYHHYTNDRVFYITGSTGVGKSTQVPKLLMYSQKMLDYNNKGKIICTQPRVGPTTTNAETISRELGLPIIEYSKMYDRDVFSNNFYVQYKYQLKEHTSKQIDSFLRIVTDGTLLEQIKNSAFLTKESIDEYAVDTEGNKLDWQKIYSPGNIYDILIVDEAHEHNANMDLILTLARDVCYVNNSIKLVIVSATMDDDEPIYRRYYRTINDNRAYPPSAFIANNKLDRANMDRRIHISPPNQTTQYKIIDHYKTPAESALINEKNFVQAGIDETIKVINTTNSGDVLLFMSGQSDINKSVEQINAKTPANVITFGFYSELSEDRKNFILKIHQTLPLYTRYKEDTDLEEDEVVRRVPRGTYTRAVIVATNVAEASITLTNLRYVVDTGYAKVSTYDPLERIEKLITLPISQSSSTQRRGRVGRIAPGEVFYLYDEEKIINNKTAYKIADSNIRDIIVGLLKSEPTDTAIVNYINDINNINNLEFIAGRRKLIGNINVNDMLYLVLKNPRAYIKLIIKQYMYTSDLTNIDQYYLYYGKVNPNIKLSENERQYLIENHDDYDYQSRLSFFSRGHTGYESKILEDPRLQFYLIHPDENIIHRNLYTGNIVSLKNSESVSKSYYYYLLKINKLPIPENLEDPKTIRQIKINYREIVFPKFWLAMDDAKIQLLVMEIYTSQLSFIIRYTDVNNFNIEESIENYYKSINTIYKAEETTLIKSNFLTTLGDISKITGSTVLNNINNLLWYSYAIPFDLQNDVLALILMIETFKGVNMWIEKSKSRSNPDVLKFFSAHKNKQGDIYFLWIIWNQIKEILKSNNLLPIENSKDAMDSLVYRFRRLKDQYLSKQKMVFNDFEILDRMYKSGELNTDDEVYYYVKNYVKNSSENPQNLIINDNVNDLINIIAKDNYFNSELLKEFIIKYLQEVNKVNMNVWAQQYAIEHKLLETNQIDIFQWAREKLLFPQVIVSQDSMATANEKKWNRLLETYLRAYSTNLIKNETNYYLQITNGVRMDPQFWSSKLKTESTFLNNKMQYTIYHNDNATTNEINPVYLTPVNLEWVLSLNPVYYFHYFYDKNNVLNFVEDDNDITKAQSLLRDNAKYFSISSLIAYLDAMNNPRISRLMRQQIYSKKLN